jgi:hypothetical protein
VIVHQQGCVMKTLPIVLLGLVTIATTRIVIDSACVRVRWLRSKPSSQQCDGPMHLGPSRSKLVLEAYWPPGR